MAGNAKDFPSYFRSWWETQQPRAQATFAAGRKRTPISPRQLLQEWLDWFTEHQRRVDKMTLFLRNQLQHELRRVFSSVSDRLQDLADHFEKQLRERYQLPLLPELFLTLTQWAPDFEHALQELADGRRELGQVRDSFVTLIQQVIDRIRLAIKHPLRDPPDVVLNFGFAEVGNTGEWKSGPWLKDWPFGPALGREDVTVFDLDSMRASLPVSILEVLQQPHDGSSVRYVGIRIRDVAKVVAAEFLWEYWRDLMTDKGSAVPPLLSRLTRGEMAAALLTPELLRACDHSPTDQELERLVAWSRYVMLSHCSFIADANDQPSPSAASFALIENLPGSIRAAGRNSSADSELIPFLKLFVACMDLTAGAIGTAELQYWDSKETASRSGTLVWCGQQTTVGPAVRLDLEQINRDGRAEVRYQTWSQLLRDLAGLSAWVSLGSKKRDNRAELKARWLQGKIRFLDEAES